MRQSLFQINKGHEHRLKLFMILPKNKVAHMPSTQSAKTILLHLFD
jgi:hypothetical protein